MNKITLAQAFYLAIGLDRALLLRHHVGKQPHHSKKGPGRKHQQGKRKAEA